MAELDILRCPVTRGSVRRLGDAELAALNRAIAAGRLRHRDGSPVQRPLERALVTDDDRWAYAVDDGVMVLLSDRAITRGAEDDPTVELSATARAVRGFYDGFGWRRTDDGNYGDGALFGLRGPAAVRYLDVCHSRVGRALTGSGRYLLDVASGPVHDEYLPYGERFERRVCVDLSETALREARARLGDAGLYVLGDIANLPLADDCVDAALSLHTIYHVAREQQATAFEELHRVLAPGATAVVVYRWSRPWAVPWRDLSTGRRFLQFVPRAALRPFARQRPAQPAPELPFHPQPWRWFAEREWPFEPEVGVWSGLSLRALEWVARPRLLGVLRRMEEHAPGFFGRVGAYPLIIVRKAPA